MSNDISLGVIRGSRGKQFIKEMKGKDSYQYPRLDDEKIPIKKDAEHVYSYLKYLTTRPTPNPHISVSVEDIVTRNGGYHGTFIYECPNYDFKFHGYFYLDEKPKIKSVRIAVYKNDKQIHFLTVYNNSLHQEVNPKNLAYMKNYFTQGVEKVLKEDNIQLCPKGKTNIENILKHLLEKGIKYGHLLKDVRKKNDG